MFGEFCLISGEIISNFFEKFSSLLWKCSLSFSENFLSFLGENHFGKLQINGKKTYVPLYWGELSYY